MISDVTPVFIFTCKNKPWMSKFKQNLKTTTNHVLNVKMQMQIGPLNLDSEFELAPLNVI